MSRWPAATRRDHDRFCRNEGWTVVRDSKGGPVAHHITYELALPDGRILRTRISRPADASGYGPGRWAHILRDQLCVDDAGFWQCVRSRIPPDRGLRQPPPSALPLGLVERLRHDLGLTEAQIASMSRKEAVAAMTGFWSRPSGPE